MGVWEAVKLYPKAVAWSVLVSTALIMEGYDLVVIGSFFAFRKYLGRVNTLYFGSPCLNSTASCTFTMQS